MKFMLSTMFAVTMSVAASCACAGNTNSQPCTQYEVGYSPEGGAEELVIKTINSAQKEIKVLAYSFTSKDVIQALIQARRRGVNVFVVADASNLKERAGVSALSTLLEAGAGVRTISVYKIMHDKVLLVDSKHVEFGSFNYSKAAAMSNSENANVCWNSPGVAAVYAEHWKSRWDQGIQFQSRY